MLTRDVRELLAEYAKAFTGGEKPAQPIAGIQGRLCRRRAGEPVRLSDDPFRRLVFLGDHSVCHRIIGLDGYQIVTSVLGWDAAYTRRKVEAGMKFDLVIFPESKCRLGTWENLLDLVQETYPEIRAKIARQREALVVMTPASLVEIEMRLGYRFIDVDERGLDDPRFMTLERYADAPDTPDAARAFLYHVVYCKEFYGGRGHTLDCHGNTGVPEYIMPNRPLEELGAHVVIPVDVVIPNG